MPALKIFTSDFALHRLTHVKVCGRWCALVLLLWALPAAAVHAQDARDTDDTQPHPVGHPEGYELVWQDEFEGDELDNTKWEVRYEGRTHGETVIDASCIAFADGLLHLTTRWDEETQTYRAGMIGSQNRFEQAYGYYEARINFEEQGGHHGAFWLQSARIGRFLGDTRRSGTEIDIAEYFGWKSSLSVALHWDGYQEENHKKLSQYVQVPDGSGAAEGFHVYGLLWTEDEYIFFIDGQEVWRTEEAISGVRQYVILSLLISGYERERADRTREAGGFPDTMLVDYVRVYRQTNPRRVPSPPEPEEEG